MVIAMMTGSLNDVSLWSWDLAMIIYKDVIIDWMRSSNRILMTVCNFDLDYY